MPAENGWRELKRGGSSLKSNAYLSAVRLGTRCSTPDPPQSQ